MRQAFHPWYRHGTHLMAKDAARGQELSVRATSSRNFWRSCGIGMAAHALPFAGSTVT